MRPGDILYRLGMRAAHVMSPLLSSGQSKLAHGLRARRGAVHHLQAWAEDHRKPTSPLLWIHAPSVGEGQQALAVARALAQELPDLQVAYTWFSPSAERFGLGSGAEVAGYLPWDLPDPMNTALDALRPSLLVFTKTEVWPVLTAATVGRGVPVSLVAGTLRPGAGRSTFLGRQLLRTAFTSLDWVGAVHESDARALAALGVRSERLDVTGDPGVDAAMSRARDTDPRSPHLVPFSAVGPTVMVAGSTWLEDEAWLREAVGGLTADVRSELVVVLAPHEPGAERVRALTTEWAEPGRPARTLAETERSGRLDGAGTVVVDRLGVLSELYTVADVAYVGGGVGKAGIHSVVEPAVCGVATVHGPRYHASRIAEELVEAGASEWVDGPERLTAVLSAWISDASQRNRIGTRARSVLEGHQGAALRTAAALRALMDEAS